ncbi:MAG: hypothetical protein WC370_10160 [Dehalococcoidales bacterium]|jgi:pyridoxal biosynthesis lyase PdxS
MGKKTRILVIAASLAAVLTLAIGGVAMAAGPNGTANNGAACICGLGDSGSGDCAYCDNVCTLLGLTSEQIQLQRQEGKSLVQIAAAQNVTEAQLVGTIMTEKRAEVQAQVAAGTLTQEKAELMLQTMEQNVIRAVNRTTTGQPERAGNNGARLMTGGGQVKATSGHSYGESGEGTGPDQMHKWGHLS